MQASLGDHIIFDTIIIIIDSKNSTHKKNIVILYYLWCHTAWKIQCLRPSLELYFYNETDEKGEKRAG